tara:strand:- start:7875 stop:8795 length:921 start_codon:yes stop_codon:yes gene_type:complete
MGIAAVQRHIEDKARVVWDGYLRSALSSLAIPGVSDRIGALKIAIGVDPLDLPGSAVDTLPRVDLYCVGAESAYDIAGTNLDAAFVYHVSAIAQYDESDPSASARSAGALAGESAEVLEQYLRDKTGGAGCIWRVDITAPVQVQTGTFDVSETRVHTMIATTEVTVQTRTTFADSPTYADPTIDPGNPTLFVQLADITSGLDASTGVGTAEANRLSTWTTTTAALAGATSLDVDASPAFAWGAGSAVTIYMSRHGAAVTGTVDADVSVILATYSILDGDRWLITVVDDGTDGTRAIATWAITWSVS